MKRLLILLLPVLALAGCTIQQKAPRISIFAQHIEAIARQEGISFAEAAAKVRALGYEGVDFLMTLPVEQLRTLDSLGFKHACAISYISHNLGRQDSLEEATLAFMKKYRFSRLLLVPGLIQEGETEETSQNALVAMETFAEKADSMGYVVMVEDYDNPRSPCYNQESLDLMFTSAPMLKHVFDTGNYYYCGDDVMSALEHFRTRIHHVHLKDRMAEDPRVSPALGTGVVPIEEVVMTLNHSGYKGWYTVEHFGSKQMLEDATISIKTVQAALKK